MSSYYYDSTSSDEEDDIRTHDEKVASFPSKSPEKVHRSVIPMKTPSRKFDDDDDDTSGSHDDNDESKINNSETKPKIQYDLLTQYLRNRPGKYTQTSLHSFRFHDPIYALHTSRSKLLQQLSTNHHDKDIIPNNNDINVKSMNNFKTFTSFQLETIIRNIQNDSTKRKIIHDAFQAAAICLLRAIIYNKNDDEEDIKQQATKSSFVLSKASCFNIIQSLDYSKDECLDSILQKKRNRSYRDDNHDVGSLKRSKSNNAGSTNQNSLTTPASNTSNKVKNNADDTKKSQPIVKEEASSTNPLVSPKTIPTIISNSSSIVTTATPSSSSAANIDSRGTVSRAILCAAASLAFQQLTPKFDNDSEDINVLDIPQNIHQTKNTTDDKNSMDDSSDIITNSNNKAMKPSINMGAVIMSAEIFAKRSVKQALSAAKRGEKRRQWKMDCMKRALLTKQYQGGVLDWTNNVEDVKSNYLQSLTESKSDDEHHHVISESDEDDNNSDVEMDAKAYKDMNENDDEWSNRCLPRLQKIIHSGPGHAILHDLQWRTRARRVVQLLHSLGYVYSNDSTNNPELTTPSFSYENHKPNYGPHLIVTTSADFNLYASLLAPIRDPTLSLSNLIASDDLNAASSQGNFYLRGLQYFGTMEKRRRLRVRHFTEYSLSGLPESPFNVIVTSYENFIQDYIHFCQIPFQAVVLDDGMSWLGTSHYDPNGQLGKVYEMGLWSRSDNHAGLAGVGRAKWDFSRDIESLNKATNESATEKDAADRPNMNTLIGITARHKIIVASAMHSIYRDVTYTAPVPTLLSFLIPQFADVVREEWDRSRIQNCPESMEHVRKLLCRGIVVYTGTVTDETLFMLSLKSMVGVNEYSFDGNSNDDETVPQVSTDQLISDGKIVQSRRFAASWLRSGSHIRLELASTSLHPILNAMKFKSESGHVCEEIVTASSISTTNNTNSTMTSALTYKNAVRCGRNFGSEQGLRQHLATLHAPPGTWLCRSCSIDCGTSQARTHHERSCGTNALGIPGTGKEIPAGGVPTVGQGIGSSLTSKQNSEDRDDQDEEGCFRVPGYKGVWVNPMGKHFLKIDGSPLTQEQDNCNHDTLLFGSADEAAKHYDKVMTSKGSENEMELNFKPDGSRIIYEDASAAAATGRGLEMLGGGASSVVPALSVINIKDLPKGVVPLLRDPKQTSRTGGNLKRFIYAYRGVCRQARKGHDRWQSQISFGGTNHYLGTFDSEWDAAAIYAWAHLILYGEEATKKAQKEGEDAVAAYEQEKKDLAAGKIVTPASPPPKKKKIVTPKSKELSPKSGRPGKKKEKDPSDKKGSSHKGDKTCKPNSSLPINISKSIIPAMSSSESVYERVALDDISLKNAVIERINASNRCLRENSTKKNLSVTSIPRCIPTMKQSPTYPSGSAMLVGISPETVQLRTNDLLEFCKFMLEGNEAGEKSFEKALYDEYGPDGMNSRFCTVLLGDTFILGKAGKYLENACKALGRYEDVELGGTIGNIDCNVGGLYNSCSEAAACITCSNGFFQLEVCNTSDIVTLDGKIVSKTLGRVILKHESICTVGSRVFLFLSSEL